MMRNLFGLATLLFLATAAMAMTIDPVWGLLAAAAALSTGTGYVLNRNQAKDERHKR